MCNAFTYQIHCSSPISKHCNMVCRCAQACAERHVEFMDAPISGGPHRAKDGTLTIMCGGPAPTFAKVEGVMKCMGSHVRLMGPHGCGTAAKLVSTNSLLLTLNSNTHCCQHGAWRTPDVRTLHHINVCTSMIWRSELWVIHHRRAYTGTRLGCLASCIDVHVQDYLPACHATLPSV